MPSEDIDVDVCSIYVSLKPRMKHYENRIDIPSYVQS